MPIDLDRLTLQEIAISPKKHSVNIINMFIRDEVFGCLTKDNFLAVSSPLEYCSPLVHNCIGRGDHTKCLYYDFMDFL